MSKKFDVQEERFLLGFQPDGGIALEGALELQGFLLVIPGAEGSSQLDLDNQLLGSDCVLGIAW